MKKFGLILIVVLGLNALFLFFWKEKISVVIPEQTQITQETEVDWELLARGIVQINAKKEIKYLFEGGDSPAPIKSYERSLGKGSGILLNKSGYILTSKHVVSDLSADYEIVLWSGTVVQVEKIWHHASQDMAILRVDLDGLDVFVPTYSYIEHEDTLNLGDEIYIFGSLWGEYPQSMTAGILSKKNVSFTVNGVNYSHMYMLDAMVSPGNSGGPLMDKSGHIVGLITAQDSNGLGFALPLHAKMVSDFMQNL